LSELAFFFSSPPSFFPNPFFPLPPPRCRQVMGSNRNIPKPSRIGTPPPFFLRFFPHSPCERSRKTAPRLPFFFPSGSSPPKEREVSGRMVIEHKKAPWRRPSPIPPLFFFFLPPPTLSPRRDFRDGSKTKNTDDGKLLPPLTMLFFFRGEGSTPRTGKTKSGRKSARTFPEARGQHLVFFPLSPRRSRPHYRV